MKKTFKISAIVAGSMLLLALAASFVLGITPLSLGLHKPVYTRSGTALAGYDAVSYFQGKPVPGTTQFTQNWSGSEWYFSSAENLKAFKANPEKYIPQFGGYCTKAVSTGFAAPGDPTIWYIRDDKLYIFSSEELKSEFLKNPESVIGACSREWH